MHFWQKSREETPGCKNVLHFNSAGASLMPLPVFDAIEQHLKLELEIGGYEAHAQNLEKIEQIYDAAAKMLNCNRDEIAFIENATRAWDMAFYSIPFRPGDRILTAESEYASNYIAFLQVARKTGAVIDVVPSDDSGQISLDALRARIDDRVKLIALTHVPTNGGLVSPAAEVGKIARDAEILFLLDACQSAGQMPLDVQKLGCNFLSATGRKFLRGPRATGFLYIDKNIIEKLEPPFLDLHAATWTTPQSYEIRRDSLRFENWEQNFAGKIGLATAIEYAMQWGLDAIYERIQYLAELLRKNLTEISSAQVHDLGKERCGIVTFTLAGRDPDEIKQELTKRKINVTTSSTSSTLLDMESRNLKKLVRASVHYFNTEEEVIHFCKVIRELSL